MGYLREVPIMLDTSNPKDRSEELLERAENSASTDSANKLFTEFAQEMMKHNHEQLSRGDSAGAEKDLTEANNRLKTAGSPSRFLGDSSKGDGHIDTVSRAVTPTGKTEFIEIPSPYGK